MAGTAFVQKNTVDLDLVAVKQCVDAGLKDQIVIHPGARIMGVDASGNEVQISGLRIETTLSHGRK